MHLTLIKLAKVDNLQYHEKMDNFHPSTPYVFHVQKYCLQYLIFIRIYNAEIFQMYKSQVNQVP